MPSSRAQWKAGDTIDLVLPMKVQIIKADEKVAADRGRVALRYGPLIYNVEQADQPDINLALGSDPLTSEVARRFAGWRDGHQGQMGRRQPAAGHSELRPRKSRRKFGSLVERPEMNGLVALFEILAEDCGGR